LTFRFSTDKASIPLSTSECGARTGPVHQIAVVNRHRHTQHGFE